MTADREQLAQARIEAALRSQPLHQPPATLAPAVLARIHGLTHTARPRFRLEWLDYALGLFLLALVGMTGWIWRLLPPPAADLITARLRLEALSLIHVFDLGRLWPVLALGLGLGLAVLLISFAEFNRPRV